MRDAILFGFIFILLPLALFRTSIGVLIWNWISLMNPHRLAWGYAYTFPFSMLVGGVTLAGLVFSSEAKKPPMNLLVIFWLLFISWVCMTSFFALVPSEASQQLIKVLKIQIFILVLLMVMQSKASIHQLLWVIVLSIGFYAVKGGILTVSTHGEAMVFGPKGSHIGDNNSIALAFLMMLPIIGYLYHYHKQILVRILLIVIGMLSLIAIMGTHSRGAFIGISGMLVYCVLMSRYRMRWIGILLILLPCFYAYMPERYIDRMETIIHYETDASAMGRMNAWHFAWNLAKERPLLGGGFETFKPSLFERYAPVPDDVHDAHSIYFEVLGEHGFIGLFLFLGILALSYRYAGLVYRRDINNKELTWRASLAEALRLSLVGYAIGGAFLGMAYFDLFYTLMGIIVILHVLGEKENEQSITHHSLP